MSLVNSLRTETKFKKTEIGEIPVEWAVVQLRDISQKAEYGYTTSAIEKPVGPKLLRITDIHNGHVNWNTVPYCDCPDSIKKKYILKSGDILFARTGATTGKSFFIRDCPEGVFASYLIRITPTSKINSQFLNFVFSSQVYWKQIRQAISGSAQGGVNATVLSKIRIPLPPLIEQGKIADILGSIDEAIEKKQVIIEKTKKLKKGLMQELLTRGIGHTKFKKTEIGEIPVDWELVKLGDYCEIFGGSTPSTKKPEYWNGDIAWAVPTDITKLKKNIIENTEKNITEKGLANSAAKILPSGSILLTSRATIGECAINSRPMATNQGFANLVCRKDIYNWFLLYRLKFIRKELESLSSGSTFREISKRSIREMRVPLPPFIEQKKIADILSGIDKKVDHEVSLKADLTEIKDGLMDKLLTGKIRVTP